MQAESKNRQVFCKYSNLGLFFDRKSVRYAKPLKDSLKPFALQLIFCPKTIIKSHSTRSNRDR